jgi:hypothetical protein
VEQVEHGGQAEAALKATEAARCHRAAGGGWMIGFTRAVTVWRNVSDVKRCALLPIRCHSAPRQAQPNR